MWKITKLGKRDGYIDKRTGDLVPFKNGRIVYDISLRNETGECLKRSVSNFDFKELFELFETEIIKVGDELKGTVVNYTGFRLFKPDPITLDLVNDFENVDIPKNN